MDATAESAVGTGVDLDAIMHGLGVESGILPEEAMRQAREHREEIIPRLIESIHYACQEHRAGRTPQREAHFFALFLLWEFKAKQAADVIFEVMGLPVDGAYKL